MPENHPDGPVWLVTAELDGDLSYLLPESSAWQLDWAEGNGAPAPHSGPPAPRTYDVMLYTERGAYRPGETVYLSGIIRDAAGRVPPPFPLAVGVTRPDGKKVADIAIAPDATGQGFFHTTYTPSGDGMTGPYTFTATLPGDEQSLGQTQTSVESFVPVRMDVKARRCATMSDRARSPRRA